MQAAISEVAIFLNAETLLSAMRLPALRSEAPWLARGAFGADNALLADLSREVRSLPLCSLSLVKAFDSENEADAFGSRRPPLLFACSKRSCAAVFQSESTTLDQALERVRAPISARLASRGGSLAAEPDVSTCATPSIHAWLCALEKRTGRAFVDVDAYLTRAPYSSASLGWHIDDVRHGGHFLCGRRGLVNLVRQGHGHMPMSVSCACVFRWTCSS